VPLGDLQERRHVGALAEQVDDQEGARPIRDAGLHLDGVEVVRDRVDVGEDGPGAGAADGAGGGEEGERRQDDLVAGAASRACRASDRASVPEAQPTAWAVPQ
jgi:hypothetical protein